MRRNYITTKEGEKADNYELTCERWRKIFQEMDHEQLIRRFGLEATEQALFITYYHEKYRLDRETGMITLCSDPDRKLAFNTVICIYNLFHYAKPDAKVCGEFVPFRKVKRAAPFDPAFQRTILKPLAAAFEGHVEEMRTACQALGGEKISQGDVGYVIKAFDCIPVTVIFWDGDDEFQAQANMLFDADITNFLHEETVCCVASDLVRRLCEEANLEVEKLLGPSR